ncbi:MAG TPA: hypothetical protein VEA69_04205 [Tepidisphaeraceae bacterium]|nr:hypothetical protein [Tepidisphaeraceae bacterium]
MSLIRVPLVEYSEAPLTRPAPRRINPAKWTAIDLLDPAAVLVACDRDLVVLLAKQHRVTPTGSDVFRGVRVVRVPNGLRLRWLELRASAGLPARLADECLYMKAVVRRSRAGGHHLTVDRAPLVRRDDPFAIRPLTAAHYQRLTTCSGRILRSQLVALFRRQLPAHVVGHRAWALPRIGGVRRALSVRHA